jgi:hypothetical protein
MVRFTTRPLFHRRTTNPNERSGGVDYGSPEFTTAHDIHHRIDTLQNPINNHGEFSIDECNSSIAISDSNSTNHDTTRSGTRRRRRRNFLTVPFPNHRFVSTQLRKRWNTQRSQVVDPASQPESVPGSQGHPSMAYSERRQHPRPRILPLWRRTCRTTSFHSHTSILSLPSSVLVHDDSSENYCIHTADATNVAFSAVDTPPSNNRRIHIPFQEPHVFLDQVEIRGTETNHNVWKESRSSHRTITVPQTEDNRISNYVDWGALSSPQPQLGRNVVPITPDHEIQTVPVQHMLSDDETTVTVITSAQLLPSSVLLHNVPTNESLWQQHSMLVTPDRVHCIEDDIDAVTSVFSERPHSTGKRSMHVNEKSNDARLDGKIHNTTTNPTDVNVPDIDDGRSCARPINDPSSKTERSLSRNRPSFYATPDRIQHSSSSSCVRTMMPTLLQENHCVKLHHMTAQPNPWNGWSM